MKHKKSRRSIFLAFVLLISFTFVVSAQEEWTGPVPKIVPDSALTAEQKELIEKALPTEAPAKPKKPRKLLIFDVNADYGGHRAIVHANYAFKLMGERTGAFETTLSRDPKVFEKESLEKFDAVFFNNNVGNVFTDQKLRDNIEEFVRRGGGLLGVHGTTAAFMNWSGPNKGKDDWPVFGEMIGGRGTNHREPDEKIFVKNEEPDHPLLAMFPREGFSYQDEFFRVHGPYSREKQRILLSIDNAKSDLNRPPHTGKKERADEDYALAWVKDYGRGKVFYSTFAHSPKIFWDPAMLQFYLAAAQFVLGDLDGATLPSAVVTDTIRSHEKLGWRLAMPAYTFHKKTLFEMIDMMGDLGIVYIGGLSFQKVGGGIDKNCRPDLLTDEDIAKINEKMRSKKIKMVSYYNGRLPGDEAACRKVFEFCEKLGVETILDEPKPESLDVIEKLANEFGINVALHNHDEKASPAYWSPEKVLESCKNRGPRIGVCGDLGYWQRAGVDPVEAVRVLGKRLMVVQVHDLNERTKDGKDVLWGTGKSNLKEFFAELVKQGVRPLDVDLEYSQNFEDNRTECGKCIEFFNKTVSELGK